MQPVLCWHHPAELELKIAESIRRAKDSAPPIDNAQKATNYFLQLGRVPGKVFISNRDHLNNFVEALRVELTNNGVESFHYKDPPAIPPGHPQFDAELNRKIETCALFLPLISDDYEDSPWCRRELEKAVERSIDRRLSITPFLMTKINNMPESLEYVQAAPIYQYTGADGENSQIKQIIATVLGHLEVSKRLRLEEDELKTIDQIGSAIDAKKLEKYIEESFSEAKVSDTEQKVMLGRFETNKSYQSIMNLSLEFARRSYEGGLLLGALLSKIGSHSWDINASIFSIIYKYKLLPDMRQKIAKRGIKREFGIYRNASLKSGGIFDGIEGSKLTNEKEITRARGKLNSFEDITEDFYEQLFGLIGKSKEWERHLLQISDRLASSVLVTETEKRINECFTNTTALSRSEVGLCIYGDEKGVQFPFEWYRRSFSGQPLCLEHPVRRCLNASAAGQRSSVRKALMSEAVRPLKVLLAGINGGGIPRVEDEVKEIAEIISKRFREFGWPVEKCIKVVTTDLATKDTLRHEIRDGGYDILHLAAHAKVDEETLSIAIRPKGSKTAVELSAQSIASWVNNSTLRFVYLACCESASPGQVPTSRQFVSYDNLLQVFSKKGVPEVIGFLWPINDVDSYKFSKCFYGEFINNFSASEALFSARRAVEDESMLWAAPVLYSGTDTKFI